MKIDGTLRPREIAQNVDAAATEPERAGIEDRLRVIFRLALEEILLLYRERSGEDTPFRLRFRKRNGDFNVRTMTKRYFYEIGSSRFERVSFASIKHRGISIIKSRRE